MKGNVLKLARRCTTRSTFHAVENVSSCDSHCQAKVRESESTAKADIVGSPLVVGRTGSCSNRVEAVVLLNMLADFDMF